MKRVICSLLVVMLVLCSIPICGNAAEREQEIIRFEDGAMLSWKRLPVERGRLGEQAGADRIPIMTAPVLHSGK